MFIYLCAAVCMNIYCWLNYYLRKSKRLTKSSVKVLVKLECACIHTYKHTDTHTYTYTFAKNKTQNTLLNLEFQNSIGEFANSLSWLQEGTKILLFLHFQTHNSIKKFMVHANTVHLLLKARSLLYRKGFSVALNLPIHSSFFIHVQMAPLFFCKDLVMKHMKHSCIRT